MKLSKITLALIVSRCISTPTRATNGYFSHGYTAEEKGMGCAGVALATNSLSSATNPANLVEVDGQMNIGVSFLALFVVIP